MPRASAASYFAGVGRAFDQIRRRAGSEAVDEDYNLGGYVVRLSFANRAMAPVLTPALAHLRARPVGSPALTIRVFDLRSTGVALPPTPWPEASAIEVADGDPTPAGPIAAANPIQWFSDQGTLRLLNQAGEAFNLLDLAGRTAFYFVPDAEATTVHERAAPFRPILHWWSGTVERALIHGAAVGVGSGAALIVGKGGSGKSTTALTCLAAGLDYLGDDYVMVQAGPAPLVYGLYGTAKLDPDNTARFPALAALAAATEPSSPTESSGFPGRRYDPGRLAGEKVLLYLAPAFGPRLKPVLPLRAIVIPKIVGRERPTMERTSAATALAALAPSTLFQMPGNRGAVFATVAELVRQVPAYVLELGPDMSAVPTLIGEVVA